MAQSTKATGRMLDKSEQELVSRTERKAIGGLADSELRDLAAQLRERRDRARGLARQQKREMRGKAEPSGQRPASDNSGTKAKADALTAALKRVGAERTRRDSKQKAPSQRSIARKALAMKHREKLLQRPQNYTADEGMQPIENRKAS